VDLARCLHYELVMRLQSIEVMYKISKPIAVLRHFAMWLDL